MKQSLKLNSKCTGWYWISGHHSHWEHVNGKVISTSKKVFVDNVGCGYLFCKVQIKTSKGIRIAYVIQSSKKCYSEKGAISYLGARVNRLKKFKNGKIIGRCSRKVYVK